MRWYPHPPKKKSKIDCAYRFKCVEQLRQEQDYHNNHVYIYIYILNISSTVISLSNKTAKIETSVLKKVRL